MKSLLVCFLSCMALALAAGPVSAQQAGEIVVPPRAGYDCCYVVGWRWVIVKNRPVKDYRQFCCSDYACALDRMREAFYEEDSRKGCLPDCQDPGCPPRFALAARCEQTVQLLCCGCDGCEYVVTGVGTDWCSALKDAKRQAIESGNDHHCGLRCYSLLQDDPCPQPCKVRKIIQRIFHR